MCESNIEEEEAIDAHTCTRACPREPSAMHSTLTEYEKKDQVKDRMLTHLRVTRGRDGM